MITTDYTIHTATLSSGLKMVHINRMSPVAWCGLAVNAGSRDDLPGKHGLAHFVEHTIFKGTTHRRSWHILNRMESVGGELNAYTTKEGTMLYSLFPEQHMARAVELLGDLVKNSVFPEAELERELDVVLEEVAGYRDQPAEAAYDDFEDLMFAGSALGHNILGCEEHLRTITREDCLHYLKNLYVPGNMVFFSVGPMKPERVFRLVERHLGELHHKASWALDRTAPLPLAPQRREEKTGSHQAHTIVGAQLPGMGHPLRYAMALLNNMLGGPGMNSMLNVNLRERRGYVYTVESSVTQFTDCGLLEIYLGCDYDDVKTSLKVIDRITAGLAEHALTPHQLDAWKKQYCGQLTVAADSTEYLAMNAGKNLLRHGTVSTIDQTVERIMAVTADELRQAAEMITMDRCSVLTFK
ncbi:M16 family metallopeptidase [Sodaliphilus sp.]|uniref:M16 family metallopeptidase n=1 Tax=Sodaliphilus sp. TaxID=2815818 RepID=UPI00388D71AC